MRVSENLSILFLLEKPEMTKDGRAPIYARITLHSQRKEISLGIKVFPEQWDNENYRVIGSSPDVLLLNNQITQARANIEKQYFILTMQYEYVTADMVKRSYQGKAPTPQEEEQQQREKVTLLEALDFEIKRFAELVDSGLRSYKTLRKWYSTRVKVEGFLAYAFGKTDIALYTIRSSFAPDFLHYLTTVERVTPNTAMKYLKNAKQVLTTATGRWIKSNPLKDFRCSYKQPKRHYLTMQEILKIQRKPLIKRLDQVRDVFLFCCFTGLAFQEVYNLTASDIITGNDGNKWIDTERLKTGSTEALPLLPIPEAIIAKYADDKNCKVRGVLLPVNSNYRFNAYLKELADLCRIDKKLTTHIARHTFATTVTLENGVPIETVSKMLGHKNIRTTQIYAQVTRKKISDDMKAAKKVLFTNDGRLKMAKVEKTLLKVLPVCRPVPPDTGPAEAI